MGFVNVLGGKECCFCCFTKCTIQYSTHFITSEGKEWLLANSNDLSCFASLLLFFLAHKNNTLTGTFILADPFIRFNIASIVLWFVVKYNFLFLSHLYIHATLSVRGVNWQSAEKGPRRGRTAKNIKLNNGGKKYRRAIDTLRLLTGVLLCGLCFVFVLFRFSCIHFPLSGWSGTHLQTVLRYTLALIPTFAVDADKKRVRF